MQEISNEPLSIYIEYDRLKADELARYLHNLSYISDKIAEDFFARYNVNGSEEFPTLDVDTINTGNSIKFTLVEGWKVRIKSNKEADIVIGIPKKLGIPIVIGYLLISIADKYQDFRNKQLDNKLKELEIQIKESELSKAIFRSNNEGRQFDLYYIENNVPEIKPVLIDTIKSVLINPDIIQFKVNNVELKNRESQ